MQNKIKASSDLKVLVLATTFPRWPNDKEPGFVFDLTRELAKKISLWVLVPHAPGAKTYEEMNGVRIIRFAYFLPKSLQSLCYEGGILPKIKRSWWARLQVPFFLLSQFFVIWLTVRRLKINFIHCHWIVPQGFFVAMLHKLTQIPYILTAHGGDVFSFKNNGLVKRLSGFALRNSRLCTANTHATGQAVTEICNDVPVKVIPMGVNTELFNPDKYDENIKTKLSIRGLFLLSVGRFAEKKGFSYLIRSIPLVKKHHPEAKLVLIGFGPMENDLKQLVNDLNLGDSIIMPGSFSGKELAAYFATADIFIGPSIIDSSGDTEGQGIVFLEAMASGTAVIASDVGGVRDIVRDGVNGLLIPQKDPQAIAEKILLLSNNASLKNALIRNGRQWAVKNYGWESIAQSFLQTFEEVVESANTLPRRDSI